MWQIYVAELFQGVRPQKRLFFWKQNWKIENNFLNWKQLKTKLKQKNEYKVNKLICDDFTMYSSGNYSSSQGYELP